MEDDFNEYGDADATDCANGDYNTFEENQLALDNEGDTGHDDDNPSPGDIENAE